MAFYVNAEDADSRVDATLPRQTIVTTCDCRCFLVTGYHAATFDTDSIVTCLRCADTDVVLAAVSKNLKELKQEGSKRTLALIATGLGVTTTAVATGGLSEILSAGLGSVTCVGLSVRLSHLTYMTFRLKAFKKEIKEKPILHGCRCVGSDESTLDGKCDLTFRDRPDDQLGNSPGTPWDDSD